MAGGAVLQIQRAAVLSRIVWREGAGPREIVRVDVIQRRLWIECLAAPLRPAIVARKNDRVLADRERNEEPLASKGRELIERPLVRFRRADGQHVPRQELPRKRLRRGRDWLRCRSHLAGDTAGWKLLFFNRKERLPSRAVENEEVSLFSGLNHRVDPAAV